MSTFDQDFFNRGLAVLLVLTILYLTELLFPLIRGLLQVALQIFYPFAIAFAFYYIVRRPVRRLTKKMPIAAAISLVYGLITVIFVLFVLYLYPVVAKDVQWIATIDLKNIIKIDTYNSAVSILGHRLQLSSELMSSMLMTLGKINSELITLSIGWISGATSFVFSLFLVPFILYYLLCDDVKMYNNFCNTVPKTRRGDLQLLLCQIDEALSLYIYSRVIIATLSAALLFIGFIIIGLDHAIFLSLLSLVCFTIPTLGAFLAAIPVLLVGFSMSAEMGTKTLIILLIVSFLEGVVISAKVMGDQLYMHPLIVLLVLFLGGLIGGMFGLLFSIPIYIVVKLLYAHRNKLFN